MRVAYRQDPISSRGKVRRFWNRCTPSLSSVIVCLAWASWREKRLKPMPSVTYTPVSLTLKSVFECIFRFRLPTPTTRIPFPFPINTCSFPGGILTQSYTLVESLVMWVVAPLSEIQISLPGGPTTRPLTSLLLDWPASPNPAIPPLPSLETDSSSLLDWPAIPNPAIPTLPSLETDSPWGTACAMSRCSGAPWGDGDAPGEGDGVGTGAGLGIGCCCRGGGGGGGCWSCGAVTGGGGAGGYV